MPIADRHGVRLHLGDKVLFPENLMATDFNIGSIRNIYWSRTYGEYYAEVFVARGYVTHEPLRRLVKVP